MLSMCVVLMISSFVSFLVGRLFLYEGRSRNGDRVSCRKSALFSKINGT
jgi:hypothetical protein